MWAWNLLRLCHLGEPTLSPPSIGQDVPSPSRPALSARLDWGLCIATSVVLCRHFGVSSSSLHHLGTGLGVGTSSHRKPGPHIDTKHINQLSRFHTQFKKNSCSVRPNFIFVSKKELSSLKMLFDKNTALTQVNWGLLNLYELFYNNSFLLSCCKVFFYHPLFRHECVVNSWGA